MERAPHKRAEFLAKACQGDATLQSEITTLLEAHEETGGVWTVSASDLAAEWLNEQQSNNEALTSTLIGQQISHYQIESLLGKGGMEEVWRAHDSRLGRDVALKVLPANWAQDAGRLRRFEQEARAISALNHPNIITIHEIGQAGELHFIITEFIIGESLRDRLQRAPLQLNEALEIAVQTATALAAAHEANVIHRDIKPENIMLRPDGLVKVLDFGLAKLSERQVSEADTGALLVGNVSTEPGAVMGTANYMSPEQARGLEVDARSQRASQSLERIGARL